MFRIKNRNGLKGQNNLAQGNRRRSDALGCKMNIVIVRAMTFIRKKFIFRTKYRISISLKMKTHNAVRKELISLSLEFRRTVFAVSFLPGAAFQLVPPETLPWVQLYWPFRPRLGSIIS